MTAPQVATLVLAALAMPMAAAAAYLAALAVLARRPPSPSSTATLPLFHIVVPAHDEEDCVGATVASLLALDYPSDRYEIIVVADNCADRTAARARAPGVTVLERRDDARRGKGYALAHGFAASSLMGRADAVAVVDADTEVSPTLLRAFAAHLAAGADALQADYGVRNVHDSWRTRLSAFALTLFHRIRSEGRERLGLSCGLRGNGMCFRRDLLVRVPYEAFSIVEDLEYGIALGLRGVRIRYVAESGVRGLMPSTAAGAVSQRQRWVSGRSAFARRRAPGLVGLALRRRDPMLLDLAIDLMIPPLSTLGLTTAGGIAVTGAAIAGGLASGAALAPWLLTAAGLALYVVRGCLRAGMSPGDVAALAWAPVYAVWTLTVRRTPSQEWVRTSRLPLP